MNVAGRKMVGSISTSVQARPQRLQGRLDLAGHVQRVAPGCFSTISSRPGPSLMTASPIGGGEPIVDVGHVAQPERRAAAEGDDGAGQVVGVADRRQVPDGQPLVRRVDEAAGVERRRRRRAACDHLRRA